MTTIVVRVYCAGSSNTVRNSATEITRSVLNIRACHACISPNGNFKSCHFFFELDAEGIRDGVVVYTVTRSHVVTTSPSSEKRSTAPAAKRTRRIQPDRFVRLKMAQTRRLRRFRPGSTVRLNDTIFEDASLTIHGDRNIIRAPCATVYGSGNAINGDSAQVTGYNNTVTSNHATVDGTQNNVNGSRLHVRGNDNHVTGNYATVHGNHNTVDGDNATVTGDNNKVSGNSNVVRGENAVAYGGSNNTVNGILSEQEQPQRQHLSSGVQQLGPSSPDQVHQHLPAPDRILQEAPEPFQVSQTLPAPGQVPQQRHLTTQLIKLKLRGDDEESTDENGEICHCCRVNKAVVASFCCGKLTACLACTRALYEGKAVGEGKCLSCQGLVEHAVRIS